MTEKVIPICRYASQATQKSRCVRETMPPAATESEQAIFSMKVKVKVIDRGVI